jgi:hypothetical protein
LDFTPLLRDTQYPFWNLLVFIVHRARLFTKLYHIAKASWAALLMNCLLFDETMGYSARS